MVVLSALARAAVISAWVVAKIRELAEDRRKLIETHLRSETTRASIEPVRLFESHPYDLAYLIRPSLTG